MFKRLKMGGGRVISLPRGLKYSSSSRYFMMHGESYRSR